MALVRRVTGRRVTPIPPETRQQHQALCGEDGNEGHERHVHAWFTEYERVADGVEQE